MRILVSSPLEHRERFRLGLVLLLIPDNIRKLSIVVFGVIVFLEGV